MITLKRCLVCFLVFVFSHQRKISIECIKIFKCQKKKNCQKFMVISNSAESDIKEMKFRYNCEVLVQGS